MPNSPFLCTSSITIPTNLPCLLPSVKMPKSGRPRRKVERRYCHLGHFGMFSCVLSRPNRPRPSPLTSLPSAATMNAFPPRGASSTPFSPARFPVTVASPRDRLSCPSGPTLLSHLNSARPQPSTAPLQQSATSPRRLSYTKILRRVQMGFRHPRRWDNRWFAPSPNVSSVIVLTRTTTWSSMRSKSKLRWRRRLGKPIQGRCYQSTGHLHNFIKFWNHTWLNSFKTSKTK